MKILQPTVESIEKVIEEAADIIRNGGIMAYPTETFYGIGAKYDDTAALERLFNMKERSIEKALPLIIGDVALLSLVASTVPKNAEKLMRRLWPGPLTIVLPAQKWLPECLTGGTGNVAVRIPGRSFALDLARALDFPITATSANISGKPPADNCSDVIKYFGGSLDMIIDCGKTPGGMPSTIVEVSGEAIKILRQGAITEEEIAGAV